MSVESHECKKEEIIEAIKTRLGDGLVTFSTINNRLANIEKITGEIRTQTIKTNGRVTKMERWALVLKVVGITVVVMVLVQKFGLWEVLLKVL